MKKTWIVIIIVLIIIAGIFILNLLQKPEESEKIRIGVITPLSGGSAKYGADIKRGYDIGAEEINEKGGVNGKKIVLIYEDSEGKPEKAVAAAHKLIQQDKVMAILGPLWSSPTLAVAPIAEKNKVVLLSSGASSPKVTGAGDFIFRNELSDLYGAEKTAQLFLKLGFKETAILHINNDFGIGQKDVTTRVYSEAGAKVLMIESFEQDATDFRTPLTKIKRVNPPALFIVAYKEMILILRQLKELGIKTQILSVALFEDPEIIEKAGNVAEGAIYTYYGTFNPQSPDKQVKDFIQRFERRYGESPEYYAPIGYDAVKVLAIAIDKGGFIPESIRDALYRIKDYPGLSGNTTFDKNGDVEKPVILKQVRNGKFVVFKQ